MLCWCSYVTQGMLLLYIVHKPNHKIIFSEEALGIYETTAFQEFSSFSNLLGEYTYVDII